MSTALGSPFFSTTVGSPRKWAASMRWPSCSRSSRVPMCISSMGLWYTLYLRYTRYMSLTDRHIYVVGCTGVQAVKIGVAADCASRLSALQTGCPLPLALLWSRPVPDAFTVEKALHLRFTEQWVRGEWFDVGPDAARLVREACEEFLADQVTETAGPDETDEIPSPPLSPPLSALGPDELVYRDAGRWYAGLGEWPEAVSVMQLGCLLRESADEDGARLWGKLSDAGITKLISRAYAGVPEEYRIKDGMIQLRTIASVWEYQKLMAQVDPRIAPHYGITSEDAQAKGEELLAARKARELAGATS